MGGPKNKKYDSIPPPPPPPPPPYPGDTSGWGDSKNVSYPTYGFTNMQTTQRGASAAHIPVPFPPDMKSDIFNVWGITGYTGNIDTSKSPNPEQTACHLAKIQQAMTGHNQFDPFNFSQKPANDNEEDKGKDDDSDSDDPTNDEIPKPPRPGEENTYLGYHPAYPSYGVNFGLAPPLCPPKASKKKKDKKCKRCAGVSGYPVKKIKKSNYDILCWACVWRAYANAAQEAWEESEDVEGDDGSAGFAR